MPKLSVKTPLTEEHAAYVEAVLPDYCVAAEFVARWIAQRAAMGDMEGDEVFEEFKRNVTRLLIGDDEARPN
jgi:hypothetical protein